MAGGSETVVKKILVSELRAGMHIHEFCGSWMDHPFWRAKFTVSTEEELKRIASCGVKEIWIDTSKGEDLATGVTRAQVTREVERELESFAAEPSEIIVEGPLGEAAIAKAASLYKRSVPRITALFAEARMGKAVDARGCVTLVDEISESVLRNPGALISVARLKRRDEYTYMHSVAVCALMVALGRQLKLNAEELRQAGLAGMLHDLGKAFTPLEVLNKPGKLSEAEFEIMKGHPERGHAVLVEGGTAGPEVLDVCLHHHEKVDGSGYPHHLPDAEISLFAKMGAVCDVYDAITSVRPYKPGWDPGEALRRMAQWKGHFDEHIFQAFVKSVGIYPVGTLVRLKSGRIAVVTSQKAKSMLAPKVKVFFSTKANMRIPPEEIDLSASWCKDEIACCESRDDWHFKDVEQLWGGVHVGR